MRNPLSTLWTPESEENGPALVAARGESLLWDAALYPRPLLLDWLLQQGVSPHLRNQSGASVLWRAACHRRTGSVRRLLEAGADPNCADQFGEVPLMKARNRAIIRLLLDHGANINAADLKGRKTWEHHGHRPQVLALLLERCQQQLPPCPKTTLFRLWGLWAGNKAKAFEELLLTEAQTLPQDACGPDGRTPLWYAASLGSLASLAHLCTLGWTVDWIPPAARPSPGPPPGTALLEAVRRVHPRAVRFLIQRGANPNAPNGQGQTCEPRNRLRTPPNSL